MSTMPLTRLLLTRENIVLGRFDNYSDIFDYLGGTIKNGQLSIPMPTYYKNKTLVCSPQYGDSFTPREAIKDYAATYMSGEISRYEYRVYRYMIHA